MDKKPTGKTWQVPLCDVRAQLDRLQGPLNFALANVMESGNYVMGEQVRLFEEEWAEYCRRKWCVAVGSGTEALILALMAMKENPLFGAINNNRVLTTPFTFWATTLAILQAGFQPEFIDVDPLTGNVPNQDFGSSPALMVAHYGRPGLWSGDNLIRDMSHAHGIQDWNSRADCWSFYPTKNLGAFGQAGAITTDDDQLAEICRQMREYGERERFHYYYKTGNHRMDELQAAILRVKLRHLDEWIAARRAIANQYIDGLADCRPQIFIPEDAPNHMYHIFTICLDKRDELGHWLNAHGVQTSVRYPVCCHQQPAYPQVGRSYPNAEWWAATNLSLPIYPEMTAEQVDYVISAIIAWCLENDQ